MIAEAVQAAETLHPALTEYDDESLRALGYYPARVSVFDHVLSKAEADACEIFTYPDGETSDSNVREYLAGEERFFRFYEGLISGAEVERLDWDADSGAYVATPISAFEAGRRVVMSLRELGPEGSMQLYLPQLRIRILGGFDRTDLILSETEAGHAKIVDLAANCELNILHRGAKK